MRTATKILSLAVFPLLTISALAEIPNGAGGDWICDAGPKLLDYVYPYNGSDYSRALIHIKPYAQPSPEGYAVEKVGENRVKGNTADGTPFECTKPGLKKKK
jgi:hypothetical protein